MVDSSTNDEGVDVPCHLIFQQNVVCGAWMTGAVFYVMRSGGGDGIFGDVSVHHADNHRHGEWGTAHHSTEQWHLIL